MKRDIIYKRVMRRLLRESGLDMGDIEFSPNRLDGVPRGEHNTPFEEKRFMEIGDWITKAMSSPDLGRKIEKLIKDPKYGDFFRKPESGEIYRGLSMNKEDLLDLLGMEQGYDLPADGYETGRFNIELLYNSVSSWTKDREVAENFSEENINASAAPYAVILTARAEENPGKLLDLQRVEQLTDMWQGFVNESEVLAVSTIKAFQVEWIRK